MFNKTLEEQSISLNKALKNLGVTILAELKKDIITLGVAYLKTTENKMSSLKIKENLEKIKGLSKEINEINDASFTLQDHDGVIIPREKYNTMTTILGKTLSPKTSSLDKYCAFICSEAVRLFGHTSQAMVAFEEMGELVQAVSKDFRKEGSQKEIMGEIADVTIMLEQLKLMYGIDSEQHNKMMFEKLAKLEGIITKKKQAK